MRDPPGYLMPEFLNKFFFGLCLECQRRMGEYRKAQEYRYNCDANTRINQQIDQSHYEGNRCQGSWKRVMRETVEGHNAVGNDDWKHPRSSTYQANQNRFQLPGSGWSVFFILFVWIQ